MVGYFDAVDALKKLRKISNVAIHSVTPAGSGNKSNEGKAKSTGKQKEKIRDPVAEVSFSCVGSPSPRDRLYVNESVFTQDNFSSYVKGNQFLLDDKWLEQVN